MHLKFNRVKFGAIANEGGCPRWRLAVLARATGADYQALFQAAGLEDAAMGIRRRPKPRPAPNQARAPLIASRFGMGQ